MPLGVKNNIILPHLLLRDLPPWPPLTFLFGLSLYGFVFEFLNPSLDHHWYVTVKMAVNADVLMLVSFTMSLMMRMIIISTSLIIVADVHNVRCALGMEVRATTHDRDVGAYMGCEEEFQQLVELSTSITSMLFGS